MITITAEAHHRTADDTVPLAIHFGITADTDAEVTEFVSSLPKSRRVQQTTLTSFVEGVRAKHQAYGRMNINLDSDAVNGGINETGVKRYHAFMKDLAKAGLTLTWEKRFTTGSYATQEAFEAAL